jgi:predicted phosphoadenosine phosphosulfate sulfurtransferase
MSKTYLKQNVYDAALDRIRRLFDEFPEVMVNFSGGKDSTVILNLSLKVAEERGRLPLSVFFLDQEAEWQTVIDYIRTVMNDSRVKPYWFQGPFKLFNATSTIDPWLYCWRDGDEWIRPKEPNSIHENICGTDRFAELFEAFGVAYFANTALCRIAGVRCEESPARQKGLTTYATYKDITWGRVGNKGLGHYTFYPIYDWSYVDVWKAIHDNGWPYCPLYDYMYQHGINIQGMRVSNVHHETAIESLTFLQEIEPETWDKVTARVSGVNAVSSSRALYHVPHELPYMFSSWGEYRDYLLENLIDDDGNKAIFRRNFKNQDGRFEPEIDRELKKCQIAALLVNDLENVKMSTFKASHGRFLKNRGARGNAIAGVVNAS